MWRRRFVRMEGADKYMLHTHIHVYRLSIIYQPISLLMLWLTATASRICLVFFSSLMPESGGVQYGFSLDFTPQNMLTTVDSKLVVGDESVIWF